METLQLRFQGKLREKRRSLPLFLPSGGRTPKSPGSPIPYRVLATWYAEQTSEQPEWTLYTTTQQNGGYQIHWSATVERWAEQNSGKVPREFLIRALEACVSVVELHQTLKKVVPECHRRIDRYLLWLGEGKEKRPKWRP